jgi:hypothetical protein
MVLLAVQAAEQVQAAVQALLAALVLLLKVMQVETHLIQRQVMAQEVVVVLAV